MDLLETELCAALELTPDGRVRRLSPGWSTILQWSAPDLVGRRVQELCVPEHTERFDKALANLLAGAPSAVVRARFPSPRQTMTLRIRLAPGEGSIVGVAEDVTERSAVLARGSELQSLVEFASDAWFVHDLDGRVRDANPYAYENLGYTREELLSKHVSEVETTIKPGRLDGVWNRMEVGKPITVQGAHRHKDGHLIPVEVRLGLFETEDDEVLMLAVARDISERKLQQEELETLNAELTRLNADLEGEVEQRTREVREAAVQLQAIIDNLADGLVAVDGELVVRAANPPLGQLLGLAASPLGSPAHATLPGELAELGRECVRRREVRQVELPLPGNRIGLAVASPVHTDQSALGAVILVRDVTLEKEVDRMKTNFIAMVSHELRTPLTSVLGFAKLTRNKLERSVFPHVTSDASPRALEQVRGNVDIIITEGQRLTHLIDDVLDIAKMEAGRMEWEMEDVEPDELVDRAIRATSALFTSAGPQLEREVEEDLPPLHGDLERLMQVLINLISNAVKFTEEGFVRVSARRVKGGVELAVEDSGEGIEPSMHGAVFEKFKQVGDTLTDKPKGTGLGLPICKQIVEAHGGEIHVRSAAGDGARFAFVIPTATATRESGFPSAMPRGVGQGVQHLLQRIEREKLAGGAVGSDILVVDDDPSLRELLRQELEDRGYNVRLARDGYEGIAQVRERRPDLVILDVMMPGLSGFDVAAMLKNDPDTQAIPILILTIVSDEQRGLRLGVDRYMHKPMDGDALAGAVHDLLAAGGSRRRVLVVDEDRPASSDVARLLETKGYQVVGTVKGEEAIEEARRLGPDLIIVDSLVEGHADLVRAIRFERELEHVLVIQLMEKGAA